MSPFVGTGRSESPAWVHAPRTVQVVEYGSPMIGTVGWVVINAIIIASMVLLVIWQRRSVAKVRREVASGARKPTDPEKLATRRAVGMAILVVIGLLIAINVIVTNAR
jgi:preprotein translocase subunit Sss1